MGGILTAAVVGAVLALTLHHAPATPPAPSAAEREQAQFDRLMAAYAAVGSDPAAVRALVDQLLASRFADTEHQKAVAAALADLRSRLPPPDNTPDDRHRPPGPTDQGNPNLPWIIAGVVGGAIVLIAVVATALSRRSTGSALLHIAPHINEQCEDNLNFESINLDKVVECLITMGFSKNFANNLQSSFETINKDPHFQHNLMFFETNTICKRTTVHMLKFVYGDNHKICEMYSNLNYMISYYSNTLKNLKNDNLDKEKKSSLTIVLDNVNKHILPAIKQMTVYKDTYSQICVLIFFIPLFLYLKYMVKMFHEIEDGLEQWDKQQISTTLLSTLFMEELKIESAKIEIFED